MKHSIPITLLLLGMFFITQLVGIAIIGVYSPEITPSVDSQGNVINVTTHNLPYGLEPPQETDPNINLISIIVAVAIAVTIMLFLMKLRAEIFLRIWFFVVITLAIGITLNALLISIPSNSSLLIQNSAKIAIAAALVFAFFKVFKRNIILHNLTELVIYPGIGAIFVPLLNLWTVVLLLILISIYDIYAVWHAGFMQKMAHYQIEKVKVFAGFFVPYIGQKERRLIQQYKNTKSSAEKSRIRNKKLKVSVAILGGGDVVFPIILAGVVLQTFGLLEALIISVGATLALAGLFVSSQKGKFYPAMPFISAGCLVALGIIYLF